VLDERQAQVEAAFQISRHVILELCPSRAPQGRCWNGHGSWRVCAAHLRPSHRVSRPRRDGAGKEGREFWSAGRARRQRPTASAV